jgi:hypothetical protein
MFTQILRPVALPLARRAYVLVPRKGLTTQQKEIMKSTIPALQEHGVTITTLFYKRLLEAHPELKKHLQHCPPSNW